MKEMHALDIRIDDLDVCKALLDGSAPLNGDVLTQAAQELIYVADKHFDVDIADRPPVAVIVCDESSPMAVPDRGIIVVRKESVDSNLRQQLMYNVAHEAQHYSCIVGTTGTWVDEMLAEFFAVRVMQCLAPAYATEVVDAHKRDAKHLSIREMQGLPWPLEGVGGNTPDAIYARAFVTDEELEAAVGWDYLRLLAGWTAPTGAPRALDERFAVSGC